ncbi:MOSC domain-containing protein [Ornithinibacillus sp. 4-3]|uniref:MOSC domain-containing protein n=1 Tax=Ornithinibacillus sp. 4-3 TaxID=3231488 RepID=A0AB39HTX1_9BACI
MSEPFAHQLLTGKVKEVGEHGAADPMDRAWKSGMFKEVKTEPIYLSKTGLVGDEVADTKVHGGPEKAIFAHPSSHYEYWEKDLQIDTMRIGAMGENIALEHGDESTFCIGDIYQFGEAIIQVSQPRQPCWKPARRFRVKDLALRIQNTGRTGWYFRVLQEGNVKAGDVLQLMERPHPKWTITACNEVMHVYKNDLQLAEELAGIPELAESWKKTLMKRLRGQQSSIEKRVYGPNMEVGR